MYYMQKVSISVAVYKREQILYDCFKYHTKLDDEIFNKVVNAYATDDNKNSANLSKYEKKMRLYTKVMNVIEMLLNG